MTRAKTLRANRRQFLAGSIGAGLSVPMINFLPKQILSASAPEDNILIVFQLRGGNDFLNNLIMAGHAKYQAARPQLKIPTTKAIRLQSTSPLYLHPALKPFKTFYDKGDLALLPGTGYSNPNYSHFRSLDIKASFDPTATNAYRGWIAEYLKKGYTGAYSIPAINLESRLNRMFVGRPVPTFTNPATFQFRSDPWTRVDQKLEAALLESNAKALRPGASPNLDFSAKAIGSTPSDVTLIQSTGANWKPQSTKWPTGNSRETLVTRYLQYCARYIISGLKTQIYLFSLGGWDTHANQVLSTNSALGSHADLLGAVAKGIEAFFDELTLAKQQNRAVVYVTSEFGRRGGENANLGCDHGAAGISYFVGPRVKGGVHSAYPDWNKATTPYSRYNFMNTVDFRSELATIIEKYWLADHTKVLGARFPLLPIF